MMSEDGFTVTSEVSTSKVIDVHMSCKAVTRRKGVHSGLLEVFEEDHVEIAPKSILPKCFDV